MGLGLGGTDAPQGRSRKSMSSERTFSATNDETFFHKKLGKSYSNLDLYLTSFMNSCGIYFAAELAEMLSGDMEKEGLYGRTLTLKLKTASFEVQCLLLCVLCRGKWFDLKLTS